MSKKLFQMLKRLSQRRNGSSPTLTQAVQQRLDDSSSPDGEKVERKSSSVIPLVLLGDEVEEDYMWWGGHYLPLSSVEGHFLTCGETGSGKSLLTHIALDSVLKTVKPGSNHRMVILDTKGDSLQILEGLGIPYTFININDMRATSWDIATDCQDYMKADELSKILFPSENKHDPFWVNGARALLSGIFKVFIYCHGTQWGLHDVYNALTSDVIKLKEILEKYPGNRDLINMLLESDAEKTVAAIKMELYTHLKQLFPAAAHSQHAPEKISLQAFLKSKGVKSKGVLVISQDLTARETSNPIIRAIFRRLVDFIIASNDFSLGRTFVFIEEASFLGELPGLLDLVTFGRSKGVSVWLSIQGVEGFHNVYGQLAANEILGNCGFKTFLKTSSSITAKWAASHFGTIETWETINVDNGKQRYRREAFLDSEFLNLPLPSKKTGLIGIFLSAKTGGYKEHFPGELLESLKPPKKEVPRQISKPKELQMLKPWTGKEQEKFVNSFNVPASPKEPPTEGEGWKTEVRKGVFEIVSDVIEREISDRQ